MGGDGDEKTTLAVAAVLVFRGLVPFLCSAFPILAPPRSPGSANRLPVFLKVLLSSQPGPVGALQLPLSLSPAGHGDTELWESPFLWAH